MTESIERGRRGAMIYDRSVISQVGDDRFDPAAWLHHEAVTGPAGSTGRGNTMFVGNVPRQFVLRHYVRGGLVGRLIRDSYLWTGENNTRPFREWRLLAKLSDNGLRVPRPAAARYVRHGPVYRADLITVRIPGVSSLSMRVAERSLKEDEWVAIGQAIGRFHAQGVFHADMNAHNLQLDEQGKLWLIDLDRGSLRQPGPWQQQTLARLHRSLLKTSRLDPRANFTGRNWEQLLEGYFSASRSA